MLRHRYFLVAAMLGLSGSLGCAVKPDADAGDAADGSALSDTAGDASGATDVNNPPTDGALDVLVNPDGSPGTDATPVTDAPVACTTPTRSCYTNTTGMAGAGVCRSGTQSCVGGVYGPCTGEIGPTAEACNGLDDDCNGMTDENLGTISCGTGVCANTAPACMGGRPGTCTARASSAEVCDGMDNNCNGAIDEVGCNCVHVAPGGNDTTGSGTAAAPYRTITKGIMSAGTGGLPNIVCVASGTAATSNFDYVENVSMRNGVSVYGGYQATGMMWPRMATCVTRIVPQNATGVSFDATVTMPTVLDGFTIQGHSDPTNAAVTVTGSIGAIVNANLINGGAGTTSYGVDVLDASGTAATPRITSNTIVGGTGTTLSAGVHSLRSAPIVQGNCNATDAAGRCTQACPASPARSIRGRPAGSVGAESYGVRLENSPNALVDQNGICSTGGTGDVAAVRVTGNARGVVIRGNNLAGGGGQVNAVGAWFDPCGGASPWVVNNFSITGNSPTLGARADGVRATGDCHPVIDSNLSIIGGVESANNDANGVLCARDLTTGIASRCTVLGNTNVQGSGGGFPPNATGVRCENGACVRIENNTLITGKGGIRAFGVWLVNTGTFVARNTISAGCAQMEGTGIRAENSFARVQNNVIQGTTCPNPNTAATFGVRVFVAAGTQEIDLHSNDIFALGGTMCTGRGITFDLLTGATAPTGGLGIVRNNIVHPGTCMTRSGLDEVSTSADPRVVENNDFWFNAAGDTLYRDENMTAITALTGVNALAGTTTAANISADPLFVTGANNFHLQGTSPCRNTGTASGAPVDDLFGTMRPREAMVDIGAAEFVP